MKMAIIISNNNITVLLARCRFLFLVLIVMAVHDILHTSHPLLHSNVAHANNNNKKNINFVSLAKWVLKFTMWCGLYSLHGLLSFLSFLQTLE